LVAAITLPGHASAVALNCYNGHRARTKRTDGATSSQEKDRPCVSLTTLDGSEVVKTLGNKRVPLVVLVESSADADEDLDNDDPEANHTALVEAVFDVINDDTFAASLSSAVDEFTVFDVIDMGEMECEAEDGALKTAHRWDVICANAALGG
jgi:hypothetical protein